MLDTARTTHASAPARPDWRSRLARRMSLTDGLVLLVAIFGAHVVWFGLDERDVAVRGQLGMLSISYWATSVVLFLAWMIALHIYGTRSHRLIGTGSTEYKRLADASFRLFGVVAIAAYLLKIDFARGYVLTAFPVGLIMLALSRWGWRQWLGRQRTRGEYSAEVLLVGSLESAIHTARELQLTPQAGYRVVGATVPMTSDAQMLEAMGIPRVGSLADPAMAMAMSGADTVVVTSGAELGPEGIQRLSWSLEPGRQHLVVAPGLMGVGGPRIHTRPVAGLPLIHVETPRYEGMKRFTKRAFDVVGSGLLIALLSPALLVIALLVRLSSPGSVFFRQRRVGLNGRTFEMLKFRSMVVNAEALLAELDILDRTEGNEVLFKMRDDPRVTPVGRVLRRFSLDELPQLFNVLRGRMSICGPRPPLESEVARYETHVHRRFLVKPGITGLWQVSGRSDLSWEDTVRLDLYYVENWSLVSDLVILWRTFRAVVSSSGAY